MDSVFKEFQALKATSIETDGFRVTTLPLIKYHKMGISANGQPMFFIACHDAAKTKMLNTNLEFISVQFNCMCQLLSDTHEQTEGIYTIISLKIDSIDLQEYFLDIVYLLIKKLADTANLKDLKVEVEKLIHLFSKFSKPPTKTIQGLWAELLVIEQSKNVDYLIRAWHSSSSDTFDFNDGIDKIEVKSTAKSKRIHRFSIEQLNPNKNSDVLIASIFSIETGIGKNIFDLIHLIEKKLADKNALFRIHEILAQTLGKDLEKAFDLFFDYQLAVDSLQFYNSATIPTIDINNIPKAVSSVHFDCDLTDIKPVKKHKNQSLLHNALF